MDDVEEQQKREKKRGFVIKEIVSTEVTYVERLRFLVEVVVVPIRETNLLDLNDQGKQFAILEKICALHSRWPFNELETQPEKLGDFVENVCGNAQLYADYLVLYEEAMARRCALLLSNRKFSDFLDKAEKDPRLQNQKIESIFILPVQRIPRYRLLLEQLLKYTPEGHPQFEMVTAALEKICAMAMYSNEAIKKRENRAKIMDIVKSIEPTTRVDLLADQDRAFIKEGPLLRQCRRGLKEFQFWLLNDQLLYGQPTPLGLYILNRQIPLSKCFVSSCESMHQGGYSFIVESPAKSFIICLSSEAERDEWLHAIKEAIVALSQQRHSRNADAEKQSIAPLWIPDSIASTCQKCRAQFSLINRRHHCRNCGAIVCDNCSRRRYKLEHVDQRKQVRVCDGCYSFLSKDGQTSIRLASLRLAKGLNPDEAEGQGEDGLHFSDDELDAELEERGNIDESDLEGFQEAMLTEGGRQSLHDQVASSDKSTTFRDDGARALPAALLQRMGKSIADVFAMRGTIAANVAGGLGLNSGSAKSTRSDVSDTSASTGSYPNSPIPAFSSSSGARVGTSQSAYTTFNNPLAARGGGAGGGAGTGTDSAGPPSPYSPASSQPPPRPPRRSLFSPASPSATPGGDTEGSASPSGAPPRRGMLFKSASAFVSSGSSFMGGAGASSVSTAAPSAPNTTTVAIDAVGDCEGYGRGNDSGPGPDPDIEARANAEVERSASPAPPAKPPKPARPPRRTNVFIPPEDLLQGSGAAGPAGAQGDPLTPVAEHPLMDVTEQEESAQEPELCNKVPQDQEGSSP